MTKNPIVMYYINMLNKIMKNNILNVNAKQFAQIHNELMIKSKKFAFHVVSLGLKENFNVNFLKKATVFTDCFKKNGQINIKGQNLLKFILNQMELPLNSTIEDFFIKLCKKWT